MARRSEGAAASGGGRPAGAVGIVGYGACVPRYRIRASEIGRVWGRGETAPGGVAEKAVAAGDQDTITLSVEAGRGALRRAGIDPARIGAIYIGSESHPYAVKPSGVIVAEALGMSARIHTADLQFACKSGTEGLFLAISLVEAGRADLALAIGADVALGAPGDPLEVATGAGGAALLLGRDRPVAVVEEMASYATDLPDFWRAQGETYPSHFGRFTVEPGYLRHTLTVARDLMERAGLGPADFAHAVFHQPNGNLPARAGRQLGFSEAQLRAGLLSPRIGNTYSSASLLGLCAALDAAAEGERILLVSYGSGAGSDGFIFRVSGRIAEVRSLAPTVEEILARPTVQLDYASYARRVGKLVLGSE